MKLLAIDGNSIMNRAFYGIKMLSNKNGDFTNAITGFMNIYLRAKSEIKPDAVVCAFDLKAPTFRHKKNASYKANRKGMPDELASQMPIIKELLAALGVSVLEKEGYEADDILGTLARISTESGNECYVMTGDKDSLQLINNNVTVMLQGTKEHINYTPAVFYEKYGFEPIFLIDLKALMGDSSDNISGVKGVGEKTASALICEHKTVEKTYENLENGSLTATNAVLNKLTAGKNDAFESKWLATIVTDVPIENNFESYLLSEQNTDEISQILSKLEMFKLLEKLGVKPSAVVVTEEKSVANSPEIAYEICEFSADILQEITAFVGSICVILTENNELQIAFNEKLYLVTDKDTIIKILACDVAKITFQAKKIYKLCFTNSSVFANLKYDVDILGYLLNASSSEYSVDKMCAEYSCKFYNELGIFAEIASLSQLCEVMISEIKSANMFELLTEIEMPLIEVLASMEALGVEVSADEISEFGEKLTEDIKSLEQSIYFMAGREFNIASPKQLAVVLFEELGLKPKKKTKTGYSTSAEVLEELRPYHEIVDLVLEYRHLSKLNSTYVVGLLKVVADDSRIHSIFKQTETRTGRISSVEPNLQNIPIRTELGRSMRKFFKAKKGYILLDADYSQIELRILASMSDDDNMKRSFIENLDIHTQTASQIFNMPESMITSEMRRVAKAVNFGIVYGIGAFSLSNDIGVSVAEANNYINDYFKTYPKIKTYLDDTVAEASEKSYSLTLFGRRRYIPELAASNKNLQAFGKRIAMNAPIQGTAADIIKIAMIKVYKRLADENVDAKLILQIHDELIIEASASDKEKAATILQEEMISAAKLGVPLIAEVSSGETWYDAKE